MKDLSKKGLKALKNIVTKNLKTTIECGMALREIRDRKLYLEEFGTFQEFCEQNWGVTRQRAYQLIDSADIIDTLTPEMSTQVDTEKAARELKKVPEADRLAVVERAASEGPVTAASVAQAHREIQGPPETLDGTEFPIPASSPAMSSWQRSDEIQQMLTAITRIKSRIVKGMEERDPMYSELNFGPLIADLTSSFQLMKVGIPFAVCPTCQGRVLSECATCKGRGTVSEFYWKHKVPEETKAIRVKAVALRKKK